MLVHEKIPDIDNGIRMYYMECFVCDSTLFRGKNAKLYLGIIQLCTKSRVLKQHHNVP
jgi:hypothetical protein